MQRSKQLDLYKPTITKWINDSLAASRGGAAAAASSGPVPWSNVSKAGSSIADLELHSHGLLSGLTGTDHHTQYVHVSLPRTITALHAFNGGLTSSDADLTFTQGRAVVGSVGWSDYAGFAHRDVATTTGYALLQYFTGENHINAPTGRSIRHRINNIDAMVMSATELTVNSVTALRTSSFTSGFTGNGFRIDNGVLTAGRTTAELDDLIVRGRMRVYELLVQQIRATNGSIFVSSTGKVKTVTGSGPYSIETETTHGFLTNDLIRAQRFTGNGVYQSNLQVAAVADTTHFTATLSSGDAPAAGMEFVRLGNTSDTTRQNSIYMSADDTYNPFIDIVTGVNSFAAWGSTASRKGRIGNLQGIFSQAGEYGIFFGTGTGATNAYMRLSTYTQELHNLPIKMYDGSSNLFMQADTTGLNYYVQTAASFADNTSIWFRRADGTKIFRVVGTNNFGGHVGSIQLEAGSSNSDMSIVTAAPTGSFARTLIQNTVGSNSSQWYFQRLADGTVKAIFPGYITFASDPSSPTNHYGQIIIDPSNNDQDAFISLRTTRTGTDRTWLIGAGSGAGNTNFRIYDYTAGATRLSIDSSGFLGIGTESAGYIVDIVGRSRIRSGGGQSAGLWLSDGTPTDRAFVGLESDGASPILGLFVAGDWRARVTSGGLFWVGNSTDVGSGAKIQTNGNMWAQGAITTETFIQLKATTTPATASGYARIFLRSSDNKVCILKDDGTVTALN